LVNLEEQHDFVDFQHIIKHHVMTLNQKLQLPAGTTRSETKMVQPAGKALTTSQSTYNKLKYEVVSFYLQNRLSLLTLDIRGGLS
jgi:hypothetical protein